jgi:hypothetical protein
VAVASPNIVYVGIADRRDFDMIDVPVVDNGENENGHVLIKTVGDLGSDEVTVIFQFWVKSLTIEAICADREAKQVREAAESTS